MMPLIQTCLLDGFMLLKKNKNRYYKYNDIK